MKEFSLFGSFGELFRKSYILRMIILASIILLIFIF